MSAGGAGGAALLDMRRLEVFARVVELGSFTRAGRALLLSQPTVSEHVRSLEEALGERLLDRLGREVLPTPAGRLLHRYAAEILRLREEAAQALAGFHGRIEGRLTVGASTIPATYILPRLIGTFAALHRAVRVTLRTGDTGSVAAGVCAGDFEAGLIGSRSPERGLHLEPLFRDELVLAVPPHHPLAGRPEAPPEALFSAPFVSREEGSGTRAFMEEVLAGHGLDPGRLRVVAELGSTEAVREAVKAGVGLSILSRRAVEEDAARGALALVSLAGLDFSRPIWLATREGRALSPVAAAFAAHLRAASDLTP